MRFLSKYIKFIIIGLILVVVIVVAIFGLGESKPKSKAKTQPTAASACGPYRNDRQVRINGAVFKAEVAKNQTEFENGLAGRRCILPGQAMLFPFSKPGNYAFWMKGMKFPIDIIWITADRKIAAIEIDFQPSTYPERRGNKIPAQYVLEVKANRSKELNMSIGTPVTF